jgi:hypothetical protein
MGRKNHSNFTSSKISKFTWGENKQNLPCQKTLKFTWSKNTKIYLVKKHKNLPGQKTKNLHDGQKIYNPNLPGQKLKSSFTWRKNNSNLPGQKTQKFNLNMWCH